MGEKWTAYPQHLPPDYYAAIGEICHRWSWLERQLGVIVRETLRLAKPGGYALTAGMTMRTVSAVLIALSLGEFLNKHPLLRERIGALATKLNNIGDLRNQYAHAYWGYEKEQNPKLGMWRFKTAEEKINPRWINKTINEIRSDCDLLAGLQVDVQKITEDLKLALRGK